jgi:tyrosyl-tRNA synthetase
METDITLTALGDHIGIADQGTVESIRWVDSPPPPPPPTWADVLFATERYGSKREIRRLIEQGAVKINGVVLPDTKTRIRTPGPEGFVVQVGKRDFFRIVP